MEDLFGIIVFAAIFLLSMLGKKKPKQGQAVRPRPNPRARVSRMPAHGAAEPLEAPARPQGLAAFLEMLEGQLEEQAPEHADAGDVVSVAPLPASEGQPLDAASHQAFHDQYVEPLRSPERVKVSHRYRLTPRTAREAVVWTAIFSKPKGYE